MFVASAGCDHFVGFAGSASGSYFLVEEILTAAGDLSIAADLPAELG